MVFTDGYAPNIVFYGETGVGKSSIINLIAGQELVHTSNGTLGHTFQHQRHSVELDRMSYTLWETTGLDEGTKGTYLAENNLRSLLQELVNAGGIHLLVYCIRADRLKDTYQRNYDLSYVTICRKKVPVALVVTGLEHQRGEMETWWDENKEVLQQSGMRFDAHACVTTLNVDNHVIQQLRLHSQGLLRELVAQYPMLPGWKPEPSFISYVVSMFRVALHRTMIAGRAKKSATMRKVIICDMAQDAPIEFCPGITAVWEGFTARTGHGGYEFLRMNKHSLGMSDIGGVDTGLLVFYTSALLDAHVPPTDIDTLATFYDVADGQIFPVIVVVRDCDDEEVVRTFQADVASRHSNIQAHFISLPSAVDGRSAMPEKLGEMIQRLCIEYVGDTEDTRPALDSSQSWLKAITSVRSYCRIRRHHS